jgi:hypothetical protein
MAACCAKRLLVCTFAGIRVFSLRLAVSCPEYPPWQWHQSWLLSQEQCARQRAESDKPVCRLCCAAATHHVFSCTQRDTVKCKLVHSRDSQHGSLDATTICAEQSSDGSQQHLTVWSVHSVSQPEQVEDSSSSSYSYVHTPSEGTEYGHRRRRVVHRKALLHLVQQQ